MGYNLSLTDNKYAVSSFNTKYGVLAEEPAYAVNPSTPPAANTITWYTDQSTLVTAEFDRLWIKTGSTAILDWGDGSPTEVIDTDANYTDPNFSHDYASTGTYTITITGDIDDITYIDAGRTDWGLFGNLSSFQLPSLIQAFHMIVARFTGIISHLIFNNIIYIFHIGNSSCVANTENWNMPNGLWDLHLSNNDLSEVLIQNMHIPTGVCHLFLNNTGIKGIATNIQLPNSTYAGACILNLSNNPDLYAVVDGWTFDPEIHIFDVSYCPNITGSLALCVIPDGSQAIYIRCRESGITEMPRGSFRWVAEYNFYTCDCDSTEIDSLLAYVDAYFVGGVVPLTNTLYNLHGSGMGIPSAAGLASKASIESKYTAAGFTATINVNS